MVSCGSTTTILAESNCPTNFNFGESVIKSSKKPVTKMTAMAANSTKVVLLSLNSGIRKKTEK